MATAFVFTDEQMREIEHLCREYHVKELSLFGSRVRGEAQADSDVDLLVEYDPGMRVTLFDMAGLQIDLERLVKAKVDLVPKDGLKPLVRDGVLRERRILYAR